MDLEQDFSLKNDFSRRHLCQNPPALAGGRLINEFGVPIYINEETETRKAIISNQKVSDSLPNFDDKIIHTNFKIKRGDVIVYDDVKYLVISDIQSKRSYEYKATMRPMTNTL
ncbi:hypothetical protein [Oceanobacillus sp. FSL K6-0127]|uniref:hypothetical protein n=1 Tax=Oceanobacillus sp. FSL K6-0127 TaxID=2921420 RepID=UPI0030EDF78C